MEGNETPQVGERYLMGYSIPVQRGFPTFFLYSGLQPSPEGEEHEFILTTTYMAIPCNNPIYSRRFPEKGLVMRYREVILNESSNFRDVIAQPGSPEHKRLNDILADFDKLRQLEETPARLH